MRKLIMTILVSIFTISSIAQTFNSNSLEIFVRQEGSPGPFPAIEYQIKHQKLKVFRNDIWKKIKIGNRKLLFQSKLNEEFIETLDSLIISLNIKDLANKYSAPIMDGNQWTININNGEILKQIEVSNCYLEELYIILKAINMKIPKEIRKIENYCLGQKSDCNCKNYR